MKAPSPESLLEALVRIPSVNPGAGGTGEGELTAFLADLLEPWADGLELVEVAPGRSNLIARFDGEKAGRSYVMEAHSDTVGVEGMTIDPFGGDVRGGRLYGRGACDTKGPMAAMLCALLGHLEGERPPATWYFISTVDEELGALGARHLVEQKFRCDGVIVAEPTQLRPIVSHKGAVRYRVRVRGRAGHSAYPEHGVNAIHAAAEWVRTVEAAVVKKEGVTFSVGTIGGGEQVNRIPDSATMEVEFRVPPGTALRQIEEMLEKATNAVEQSRAGCAIQREQSQSYPPFALDVKSPFRQVLASLFSADNDPGETARYSTNAGFFAQAEIPCVVYGPGSIEQAHTADEWIEISSLIQARKVLGEVIRSA